MNHLPFKTAILQVADTGPMESLAVMFQSVGIECLLPDEKLRSELRSIGCDTVLDPSSLVRNMGYPPATLQSLAGIEAMNRRDVLFVDVKGVRSHPKIARRWSHLERRVLWYRINGGKPEHVTKADGFDCGDEINPPCPVVTPNQWYGLKSEAAPYKWEGRSYAFWPNFVRFDDYRRKRWHEHEHPDDRRPNPPVCLIHNLQGWGYGPMIPGVRDLGVKCYGKGSPDGLVPNHDVPNLLGLTLANVHLKSSDAPGYAIYETLAAACPLICPQRLIERCRMGDLLVPGETCLTFDHNTRRDIEEGHDADVALGEIAFHLERLKDPEVSREIGEAGKKKLKAIQWSPKKERDVGSFQDFLVRNYGG